MKKIIFFIICLLSVISFANASTNKLYFTETGNRLYYDTDLFDKDIFISNLDMIPGREYNSQLEIKNDTNITYKLYFKVNDQEQSELAKELLDNIKMEIRLDGSLIYDGYANGLDYSEGENGINLQNAIYIGEYSSNKVSVIDVKTKLVESYSNTNNTELSRIEWEFYAVYDNEIIPINPLTGSFMNSKIIGLLLIIMIICVLLFVVSTKMIQRERIIN